MDREVLNSLTMKSNHRLKKNIIYKLMMEFF